MQLRNLPLLFCAVFSLAIPSLAHAQAEEDAQQPATEQAAPEEDKLVKLIQSIDWKTEGTSPIGTMAQIEIPDGYCFTGADGTIKLMREYGNLTSGAELGYLSPMDFSWFAEFEFDEVGYVKDNEKDKLDADEILKQLRENQKAANKMLRERGSPTLTVVGWHTPPFYNPDTKNLEWAIKLHSSDGTDTINYKTKLLGRRGVMDVVLVCSEEQLSTVVPQYEKLLKGFTFKKEESYAAFTKGDKVAKYGLTGLIVGGTLLAAAKTGLLAKLWKPIAAGLVAIGTMIKRIIRGKKQESI
ncbi:DUF2167 domain-containing protein [Luteolibacter pohnpeiensis]|uniref:DUF2167 domain-containing protein n=1 Tax=Luteolibacter pohnpeiensis TaxID=454153 RepID=A0A934VW12_9BACT|nr:DUF2167 domain-containing protein [Luteolibacter pohnpeiensis]MBK1882800.1 DUF2167 domain-containing protein [Luteolibacter pohnpeiensis]